MAKKITTSKTTTTKSIKKVEDKQKPAPAAIKEQPKAKPVAVKSNLGKKEDVKVVAPVAIKKVESEKVATKSPDTKNKANKKAKKEVQPAIEPEIKKEIFDSTPIEAIPIEQPKIETVNLVESESQTSQSQTSQIVEAESQASQILDTEATKTVVEKSAEQLAYEAEVEQFNKHIENVCKFWHSHCSHKSHYEKHDITSACGKQGIEVTFSPVDEETTKVTFTKRRTAFSFQSKTIFW